MKNNIYIECVAKVSANIVGDQWLVTDALSTYRI